MYLTDNSQLSMGNWKLKTDNCWLTTWKLTTYNWLIDNWRMSTEKWKPKTDNYQPYNWQLTLENWQLTIESCQPKTDNWKLRSANWQNVTDKWMLSHLANYTQLICHCVSKVEIGVNKFKNGNSQFYHKLGLHNPGNFPNTAAWKGWCCKASLKPKSVLNLS